MHVDLDGLAAWDFPAVLNCDRDIDSLIREDGRRAELGVRILERGVARRQLQLAEVRADARWRSHLFPAPNSNRVGFSVAS